MRRTSNKDLNNIKNPQKSEDTSSLREKKQRQKRAAPTNLFLNTYTASDGGSGGTTFNGYGIQALPSSDGTVLLINQPYITETNPILVHTMVAKLNSMGVMSSLFSLQGNGPLKSYLDPLAACISSDNGIMISGTATDTTGSNANTVTIVMKLDTNMAIKWATSAPLGAGDLRGIEHFTGTNAASSTIACTSDGGVVFSAFSKNTNPDIILSKLDNNGQALWSYNLTATDSILYSPGRGISYLPYPVPFYVAADGSIVMTYTPNVQFSQSGELFDTETMVVTAKINLASQTTTWATVWGVPLSSDSFARNLATAISPTKDGGTAISIYSSNAFSAIANSNPENSVILKLNAQGTGVFASLFGGNATSGGCRPSSLIEDVDAGLIAVGSTSGTIGTFHYETHITKLTADGAFKWQSILGSKSCTLFSAASAYVNSADNTVMLSGSISKGCLSSGSLFVAKTPTNGSTFGCQQLQSSTPALFASVVKTTTPIQMSIKPYNLITTDRTKNIVSQSLTPKQYAQCSTVKTPPPTPASAPKTSSSNRLTPFFFLPYSSSATILPSAWLDLSPTYQLPRSHCDDVQNGRFIERPSAYYQSSPSVTFVGQLMLASVLLYLAKIAYSFMMGTSSSEHGVKNNNALNSNLSPVDRSSFFSGSAKRATRIPANSVTQLSTGKTAKVAATRQYLGR